MSRLTHILSSSNKFRLYKTEIRLFIAGITVVLLGHAITELLFAVLGKTPANKNWNYALALYILLGLSGMAGVVWSMTKSTTWQKLGLLAASILSGVLVGFYYGGIGSGGNSQIALLSAIAIAFLAAILTWWQPELLASSLKISTVICAYGFAMTAGIYSISAITSGAWLLGLIMSGTCFLFLVLTLIMGFNSTQK